MTRKKTTHKKRTHHKTHVHHKKHATKKPKEPTKGESLIHVRLEIDEATQAKKDILMAQADAIGIAQTIRKYKELRMKELLLKLALQKKIKETKADLKTFKSVLPPMKVPTIVKEHEEKIKEEAQKEKDLERKIKGIKKHQTKPKKKEKEKSPEPKIIVKKEHTLEDELKEIQAKLAQLG